MAKKPLSRIHRLSARIEAHLHQFTDEPDGDEADSMPEMKKKKNPYLRSGAAVTAVGVGTLAGMNKNKIAAGFKQNVDWAKAGAAGVKEAGKDAAFKGMRGTAGVMKKGAKIADKVATQTSWKHQGVRKGAASVSDALAKGAKVLKKNSMKFFARDIAAIHRIESKFRAFGI